MEQKEQKINIPEGYEIDEENSTFECIKFKPKKEYITIWDVYSAIHGNILKLYADAYPIHQGFPVRKSIAQVAVSDLAYLKKRGYHTIAKYIAYGALLDIAKYYNGEEWWPEAIETKYFIDYDHKHEEYTIGLDNTTCYTFNIYFRRCKDVEEVIDNPNFREILDTLFK